MGKNSSSGVKDACLAFIPAPCRSRISLHRSAGSTKCAGVSAAIESEPSPGAGLGSRCKARQPWGGEGWAQGAPCPPRLLVLLLGNVVRSLRDLLKRKELGRGGSWAGKGLGAGSHPPRPKPQAERYWFQCLCRADAAARPVLHLFLPTSTFLSSTTMAWLSLLRCCLWNG